MHQMVVKMCINQTLLPYHRCRNMCHKDKSTQYFVVCCQSQHQQRTDELEFRCNPNDSQILSVMHESSLLPTVTLDRHCLEISNNPEHMHHVHKKLS